MLYNLLQSADDWLDERGLYSLLQVLYQIEFRAFGAVLLGFALVLLFGRPTIRWLLRQKIGDVPEFYNADLNELMKSKSATPTMGGILIIGSVLATALLLADLRTRHVIIAVFVLLWLVALGGIDDWLKLTSATRTPGSRNWRERCSMVSLFPFRNEAMRFAGHFTANSSAMYAACFPTVTTESILGRDSLSRM